MAAKVAVSAGADLLILLSDIDGLYDKNPKLHSDAKLIPTVEAIDEGIRALAEGAGSELGTGGMATKINAAAIATGAGCDMVIANGDRPENIYEICRGDAVGTRFKAVKV